MSSYTLKASDAPNQNCLPLTAAVNDKRQLEIGGCDVHSLAKEFSTPLFVVCEDTFRASCRAYVESLAEFYPGKKASISYATKAWPTTMLCKWAIEEGCHLDVVSGGELATAQNSGATGSHIYFHGNNKGTTELEAALDAGATVIADNYHELELLKSIATKRGVRYEVFVRLTPGIEIDSHEYIQTGHLDTKFGFDPDDLDNLFKYFVDHKEQLGLKGLHAHIGSQACELKPFLDLARIMLTHLKAARAHGHTVPCLNLGGGLGVCYTPEAELAPPPKIRAFVEAVSKAVIDVCKEMDIERPELGFEAGRSIVATSAATLYSVGSTKRVTDGRLYVSVDGGMSDNPRPLLYGSKYYCLLSGALPATSDEYKAWRTEYIKAKEPESKGARVTIAGKHCEQGDLILQHAPLPRNPVAGDILAFACSGAYQYSMASNYNKIPRPAAVSVKGGKARLMIRREQVEDLLRLDVSDSPAIPIA